MDVDINQYIEVIPKRDGSPRPFIKGTRVELIHIVSDSEFQGMSAEEIAAGYDNVPLAAVYAALAFYHANRKEVLSLMREDDKIVSDFKGTGIPLSQHGSSSDASSVSP